MPYDLEKLRQSYPDIYGDSPLREVATDVFDRYRPSFEQRGIRSVDEWAEREGWTDTWNKDEQDIIRRKRQAEIDRIRKSNLETMNFVSRAAARGIDQLWAMGYGAAGILGSATGIEPIKKWGLEGYQRSIEEAAMYPGTEFGEGEGVMKAVKGGQWVVENWPRISP